MQLDAQVPYIKVPYIQVPYIKVGLPYIQVPHIEVKQANLSDIINIRLFSKCWKATLKNETKSYNYH